MEKDQQAKTADTYQKPYRGGYSRGGYSNNEYSKDNEYNNRD